MQQLVECFREEVAAERVREVISDFARERVIFQEGARLTGLALPVACYRKWAALVEAERQRQPEEVSVA